MNVNFQKWQRHVIHVWFIKKWNIINLYLESHVGKLYLSSMKLCNHLAFKNLKYSSCRQITHLIVLRHVLPSHLSCPCDTQCCWWFRNPKQPPGMFLKPCEQWEITATVPSISIVWDCLTGTWYHPVSIPTKFGLVRSHRIHGYMVYLLHVHHKNRPFMQVNVPVPMEHLDMIWVVVWPQKLSSWESGYVPSKMPRFPSKKEPAL